MAFSQKELDIIKYGQANGKSRAEVESALASFRSGVVPTPKPQVEQTSVEPSLASKLGGRAKDFGKETLNLATLGATSLSKQDVQEARQSPQQGELVALQALSRAFQAPIRMTGAVGGAIGDVVGAGIEATGVDKPIAQAIAPIAQSQPAQKAMEVYKSLPQETQDVLSSILNTANIPVAGVGVSAVKQGVETGAKSAIKGSALDVVKSSSGNLTQKALDFISADPSKKVETILKRSTPEELDNYLAIAEKSSQSGEAKSVFEVVGDKMFDATKELKTKLDGIGASKSEVMAKNGNVDFTPQTAPFVSKLEEILNSFTEIDRANAPIVKKFIADAKNIKTAQQADAFIDKAQDALYTGDRTMTLPKGSALEKKLQRALGEYNTALKSVVPEEYATLNKQYADLVGTLEVLNRGLGEVVEGTPIRGAGLVKQYFSPSASRTKELFEFIKNETGGRIDLAKDATLAKFAGQLYDDANVNSLLGGIKDIPTTPSAIVGKVIERVGGEKVTDALRSSTVKKAKSSTSPKESKSTSVVDKKPPTESKLVQPSTNSTTNPTKSKGIRGMIELNPKNWFEEVGNSADAGLKAKTKDFQLEMAKEAARTMRNNGVSVEVPTTKNAVQILEQARDIARKKKVSDVVKDAMPSDKMKPFLGPKNNNTELLKGLSPKQLEMFNAGTKAEQKKALEYLKLKNDLETNDAIIAPKKKVVSLEQEAKKIDGVPVFRGQSHEGLTAFDGGNKSRFLNGMDGTSFSTTKESALNYGNKIVEGIVPNNTILRMKDLPEELKIYIKSEVKKLTVDDYIEGTAFEKIVSSLARVAKGRKKNAIDLTEFFPKSKIDDEIRVLNKDGVKVTPKLSPLEQEAKKYKSAEEFVKAQGTPVYHGTGADFTEFDSSKIGTVKTSDWGSGIYLTPSRSSAEYYSREAMKNNIYRSKSTLTDKLKSKEAELSKHWTGNQYDMNDAFWKIKDEIKSLRQQIIDTAEKQGVNVKEYVINKDTKLYRHNVVDGQTDPNLAENLKLKEKGFGGIEIYGSPTSKVPEEIVIFNPEKIKTKSQLTDIWNKASGK